VISDNVKLAKQAAPVAQVVSDALHKEHMDTEAANRIHKLVDLAVQRELEAERRSSVQLAKQTASVAQAVCDGLQRDKLEMAALEKVHKLVNSALQRELQAEQRAVAKAATVISDNVKLAKQAAPVAQVVSDALHKEHMDTRVKGVRAANGLGADEATHDGCPQEQQANEPTSLLTESISGSEKRVAAEKLMKSIFEDFSCDTSPSQERQVSQKIEAPKELLKPIFTGAAAVEQKLVADSTLRQEHVSVLEYPSAHPTLPAEIKTSSASSSSLTLDACEEKIEGPQSPKTEGQLIEQHERMLHSIFDCLDYQTCANILSSRPQVVRYTKFPSSFQTAYEAMSSKSTPSALH